MSDEEALALADPDAPDRHIFWNEKWFNDKACCEESAQAQERGWGMGSHYHCPRCWASTGMYGHSTSMHFDPVKRKSVKVEFHRHCPDWCEISGEPEPAPPSAAASVAVADDLGEVDG